MVTKEQKKLYKTLGAAIFVGFLIFTLIFVAIRSSSQSALFSSGKETVQVVDPDTNKTITFGKNGLVEIKDDTGTYYQNWDASKITSFFDYISQSTLLEGEGGIAINAFIAGKYISGNLPQDDELLNEVFVEVSNGTGGSSQPSNGGSGSGSITDYLTNPTSTPVATGGSAFGFPTPTPGRGPSWCKHWRLSYCADNLFKTPVPTASDPFVPLPPDCNNVGNKQTGKTTITNELCVKEETP